MGRRAGQLADGGVEAGGAGLEVGGGGIGVGSNVPPGGDAKLEGGCAKVDGVGAGLEADGAELVVDSTELELDCTELELSGVGVELCVNDAETEAGPMFIKAGSVKFVIRFVASVLRFAWFDWSVNSKAIAAAYSERLRRLRPLERETSDPFMLKD